MLRSMRPKKHLGDRNREVDSLGYPLGMVDPICQPSTLSSLHQPECKVTYLEVENESRDLLR